MKAKLAQTSECQQIKDQAEQVTGLSKAVIRALRKLRQLQTRCRRCAEEKDCAILGEINQQITVALAEIADEWMPPVPDLS